MFLSLTVSLFINWPDDIINISDFYKTFPVILTCSLWLHFHTWLHHATQIKLH